MAENSNESRSSDLRLTRRQALAGLGTTLATAWPTSSSAEARGTIGVIGAGLAGFAAAYELKNAGYRVHLIEQAKQPGGRVQTVRGRFSDDVWVDTGGSIIGGQYYNFFAYAGRLGLSIWPRPKRSRGAVGLFYKGRLVHTSTLREQPELWPVRLHPKEQPRAPGGLLPLYLLPITKQLGHPDRIGHRDFAKYDDMSLLTFLKQQGASDGAITLIERTLNYNRLDSVSALCALRDVVRPLGARGEEFYLEGGMARMPEAFTAHLKDELRLETTLVAVQTRSDGALIRLAHRGRQENLRVDRVIITLPFTALRKVSFSPALPEGRKQIIDTLPYTRITHTYVETRPSFEGKPSTQVVYTDTPLERIFNASHKMSEGRGLYLNWINGVGLDAWRDLSTDAHDRRVVEGMTAIWPKAKENITSTLTTSWDKSYCEGAYAHFAPGQLLRYVHEIPKPIGRIHFAGEHTDPRIGSSMEGALASGKRAAAEVMAGR